jgi:hypothetical protein
MAENIPNGLKIYHHLSLLRTPKFNQLGILVLNYTIWQPCRQVGVPSSCLLDSFEFGLDDLARFVAGHQISR